MENKFTISEQKVVFLGGSHHGEERKVNIVQLKNSISGLIAIPKKISYTAKSLQPLIGISYIAKWSDQSAPIDANIEVEYYKLVYVFDFVQTPYLIIEDGNPVALLNEYLNDTKNPNKIFQSQQGILGSQLRMLEKLVPGLTKIVPIGHLSCPICKYIPDLSTNNIKHRIVHLNDQHKWSLEQIADYLDTLPIDLKVREDNATSK